MEKNNNDQRYVSAGTFFIDKHARTQHGPLQKHRGMFRSTWTIRKVCTKRRGRSSVPSLRDYVSESRSYERWTRIPACHAARRTPSTSRRPPSMCLSNDNKLPNEYVQSYSIIATTGGGGGRPIKRPTAG